jgi:hypothetical protein
VHVPKTFTLATFSSRRYNSAVQLEITTRWRDIMKIELRNIKHSASLSEETNAYTATVWVDGKPFADVSNHGTGGSDEQHPIAPFTYADIKRVNEWLAVNGKPLDMSKYNMENVPCDLEHWCGQQLTERLIAGDLKRALKSKVLFSKDGKIFQMSIPRKRSLAPQDVIEISSVIRKKHGDVSILNMMPFDAALAIYSTAA